MNNKRQIRSVDEVMTEMQERAPALVEHMFLDRDWIWYCGPSLQGEANKPHREVLKAAGFRWSPGGHLMPDNQTKGSWGHSCAKPMWRKPQAKAAAVVEEPVNELVAMFQRL